MNPPPRSRPFGTGSAGALVLLFALANPARAGAGAEHSILARVPSVEAGGGTASGLGPDRAQGDFAPLLAELAAAGPDSTIPATVTPAVAAEKNAEPSGSSPEGERQPALVLPILSGFAGGAAGLYGGAVLGLALNEDDSGDWDELGSAVLGGLVGEVVLLPLGVHLGNARKGSFVGDLAISAFTGLAGIALIGLLHGSTIGAIAGAGLQLGSVVYVERREGARRIETRRPAGGPAGP